MNTKNNDHAPDIVDLQAWLCLNKDAEIKKIWNATKYLSAPYEYWLGVWRRAGEPDIIQKEL